jgi:hypothetical protein
VQPTEPLLNPLGTILELRGARGRHLRAPNVKPKNGDVVTLRQQLAVEGEWRTVRLRSAKAGLFHIEPAIGQGIKVGTCLQSTRDHLNLRGLKGDIIQVDGGRNAKSAEDSGPDGLEAVQGQHAQATTLLDGCAIHRAGLRGCLVAGVCEHKAIIELPSKVEPLG